MSGALPAGPCTPSVLARVAAITMPGRWPSSRPTPRSSSWSWLATASPVRARLLYGCTHRHHLCGKNRRDGHFKVPVVECVVGHLACLIVHRPNPITPPATNAHPPKNWLASERVQREHASSPRGDIGPRRSQVDSVLRVDSPHTNLSRIDGALGRCCAGAHTSTRRFARPASWLRSCLYFDWPAGTTSPRHDRSQNRETALRQAPRFLALIMGMCSDAGRLQRLPRIAFIISRL